MLRPRATSFFSPPRGIEFPIGGLTGALNTTFSDLDIADTELSGGQNIIPASETSFKKRGGDQLYGQFLGTTTGILGGFAFSHNNVQENLAVYDVGVYRDVSQVWTALTSVTMTTNKPADFAYFPLQGKTYIVNQTDNVVKYAAGSSSGDQTDSSFKKGKYICHFKNRLLTANITSQADYVWYTDLGLDTFSANNYFRVVGEITGLKEYYDKVMIFTKRKVHRLQNFTFSGTAAGPESVDPLPTDFGAIYERTIAVVNGLIYFLGQDTRNIANIYVCDGYTAKPISDPKIKGTLATLSATQLANSCAVAKGNTYVLAVPESGQTTNTMTLSYDTFFNKFLTPQFRFMKGRSDFTCMWSVEVNSAWSVFGGTSGTGQIYQVGANDGLYDELPEERYLTSGSYNVPIDANPAKRAAQSFKMSQYNVTQSITIDKVALLLKKNTGTTTNLTVRIESDSAGAPSGTALASATLTAFTGTSYAWQTVTFASPASLMGSTTYWLVLQHVTEGTGSSQYHWLADSCTATYTNGSLATFSSSAWHADTVSDADFIIYAESPIDAYGDTKAFLVNDGKQYQLQRFLAIFSSSGNFNMEIGFTAGTFATFQNYLINLTSTAVVTWGGGNKWGDGSVWGGQPSRNFTWTDVYGFAGRTLKARVRNRNANQQFEFNRILTSITKQPRQV